MRKALILSMFLFASSIGFAQTHVIDSLNTLVPKTSSQDLETLFGLLNDRLQETPFTFALPKAKQSLEFAKQNKLPLATVFAHRNLWRLYSGDQQQTVALEQVQTALSFARQQHDVRTLALAHFYAGDYQKQERLFTIALENILEASKLFNTLNDLAYLFACHYTAASIYYEVGNYYQCLEEAQLAIDFYQKIKPEDRSASDEFHVMSTYNTMGLGFVGIQQYNKAILHFDLAEQFAVRNKNQFWIGLVSGNRAGVYRTLGQIKEALRDLLNDLYISQQHDQWASAGLAAFTVSEILTERGALDSSKKYLDSGTFFLSKSDQYVPAYSYWRALAKLKAAQRDFKGAYIAETRYNSVRDSLNKQKESLNLMRVKTSYELNQKQREIEKLAKNNELSVSRIRLQNAILVAAAIIVILMAVLAVTLVRNNQKKQQANALIKKQYDEIGHKNEELESQGHQLQETNQMIASMNTQLETRISERTIQLQTTLEELDTFLYRSSHDMRRPLSTLLGLGNLAKLELREKDSLRLFEMMVDTARHMDNMLLKLQMAYELNRQEMVSESVAIESLLQEVIKKLHPKAAPEVFVIESNAQPGLVIFSNAKLLTIILKNILENAVNFSKKDSTIRIHIQVLDYAESNQIIITDNGIGIEELYLPMIFDQYFKGTQVSHGNGLGLFLVKKSVEKLKGTVHAQSQFGVGSTFIINLPKRELEI